MQRRALLIGSAAATAPLALGCASAPIVGAGAASTDPSGWMSYEDVEAAWANVLETREALTDHGPLSLDGIAPGGRSKGRVWTGEDLSRKAARTLFLSGAFRDLPEHARAHPTVQDSMFGAMPEFDEALLGVKSRLDALTPTERADLSRAFREDPELAERVVALLDREGARAGASEVRRLHLRRLGVAVCERLNQSSDALIGEYRGKLDKVYARAGSDAELERKIAASLGEQAFEELRTRTLEASERYRIAGAKRIHGPPPKATNKTPLFVAGGIFLGLAAISGIAIVAAAAGGGLGGSIVAAFIGTAGGVFLLVGLILMIVGAAI